jgi:MFS family permease
MALNDPQSAKPAITREGIKAIAAASFGLFVGAGITLIYSASVIMPAILADTGWSRAAVTGALGPATLAVGLLSPVVGALTDRFGPRRILLLSSFGLPLGLFLLPLIARSVHGFQLGLVVAAILAAGTSPVAYSYLLIGWLPHRRGLAMGIALACSGLGVAVVPATLSLIIPALGWRGAYDVLGCIALCIGLPSAFWLVKNPPRVISTGSVAHRVPGKSLAEALRSYTFWVLLVAFALNSLASTAGSISLPLIAADSGIPPKIASISMVIVGVTIVLSRVWIGALFDRVPTVLLTVFLFLAPVLGHLTIAAGAGIPNFMVAALLFGLSVGCDLDALGVLVSRQFGMRDFGKIYGINFCVYAFCGGSGPGILHQLHDRFVSYGPVFLTLSATALLALVLVAVFLRTSRLAYG